GGLGVVPGANIGDGCAVFEAVHGSAPDLAGRRLANPTAVLLSAVNMLRYLDEVAVAERVERAVHTALSDPKTRTRDLGGDADLDGFTAAVVAALE
ncbi:MAG: isocitrate/isopropylmalate family dehydrogenase, partial [Myxococcota bacterium]|nr:isocitrate/isopropylmalate family dehydrogenase [Myxococcota bacterium]